MDATIEVTLDADFLAAAEAVEKPPAEIVADLMREFVSRERSSYTDFLRRKVAKAQQSADAGFWRTNEDVQREFAEKKRRLASSPDDLAG